MIALMQRTVKKKHILLNKVNEFGNIFQKHEKFSIWDPKATLSAITGFISKLLVIPTLMDIWEVQPIVKILYRLANTTPERFTAHWDYQSANLIKSPATRVWLATNNALCSNWSILDQRKLEPKPKVVLKTADKAGVKKGSVNIKSQSTPVRRAILHPVVSTRQQTPLGNFRFLQNVTMKDTYTPMEEITSKAPRLHHSSITVKMPALEKEGNIGEKIILEHIHTVFKYLLEIDPNMAIYKYPGKIQHSAYVSPH